MIFNCGNRKLACFRYLSISILRPKRTFIPLRLSVKLTEGFESFLGFRNCVQELRRSSENIKNCLTYILDVKWSSRSPRGKR